MIELKSQMVNVCKEIKKTHSYIHRYLLYIVTKRTKELSYLLYNIRNITLKEKHTLS